MLEFKSISKSFSGVEVLHQVSCKIDKGRIIALVGENGAGKSTLMKIASGILIEYNGEMLLNDAVARFRNPKDAERAGIAIIHQELNLVPDLSIGENIFLGREPVSRLGQVDFRKLFAETNDVLQTFNFPYSPSQKVRNLPVGWQQMVEIARTLSMKAEIIIMDEPTSALSEHEIDVLFGKMRDLRDQGKTLIFISHRLNEIFTIADEVVVLRDGFFEGQFSIGEVNREKLIELMIGRRIGEIVPQDNPNSGEVVLNTANLAVRKGRTTLLSDIGFTLRKGEILGVAGLLGAGRTELLRFLYGELDAQYSGEILLNGDIYIPKSSHEAIGRDIAFLSEDRKTEGIFPDHSIGFNSSISMLPQISAAGVLNKEAEQQLVTEKLDGLSVKRTSLRQKIPTLSGGNQQKVLLARVLLLQPQVLLLDEPTRGIDVGAKQEIYALVKRLSQSGVAVLVTSSEIPELMSMCHRVLVLSAGKQTALLSVKDTNPQEILKYAFKQV
ncbi:MAG: sugar ABC transporter ATP-binding protein [Calditrichia bacterium]